MTASKQPRITAAPINSHEVMDESSPANIPDAGWPGGSTSAPTSPLACVGATVLAWVVGCAATIIVGDGSAGGSVGFGLGVAVGSAVGVADGVTAGVSVADGWSAAIVVSAI
jgi:hypothetical protein